jgi:exodeoxyribonuclease VII large subunit
MQRIDEVAERMYALLDRTLTAYKTSLAASSKQLALASPTEKLKNAGERIRKAEELMNMSLASMLEKKKLMLASATGRLEAINPLAVISRGYSVTRDENESIVSSVEQVSEGDGISILVSDGSIRAVVTEKRGK